MLKIIELFNVDIMYHSDLMGIVERVDFLNEKLEFYPKSYSQLSSVLLELTHSALRLNLPAILMVRIEQNSDQNIDFEFILDVDLTSKFVNNIESFIKSELRIMRLFGGYLTFESNPQSFKLVCKIGDISTQNSLRAIDLEELVDLLRYTESERDARKKADAIDQMKSQFVANMSHELRTPLNSIIGFSEMLEDGIVGEISVEQKEVVTDILGSAHHLLNLINQILDISKIDAKKITLNLSSVDISVVIEDSVHQLDPLLQRKQLKYKFQDSINDSFKVNIDVFRIKQVLINLLSNAIKFSPNGEEIQITLEEQVIDQKHYVVVSVKDNGDGIKKENFSKIFKEFSQVDESHTRAYQGTGLGLALSKKLVEAHDGSIWFESEYGKGTTFTFKLPRNQ